jgi:cobalt-zinc-cadmium efflux system outer membrane protein
MLQKSFIWLTAVILFGSSAAWAQEAPLAQIPQNEAVAESPDAPPALPALAPVNGNIITLNAALEKALANSPQLKSANSAMLASEGARRQAGALPNPEIGIEAENVAGQGAYKGTRSAEFTYGVSQLIEIGGKRSARQEAAGKGYEIAGFDYKAARLDLIRNVTSAYADAVAAQEEVKIADEQRNLAEQVLETVSKRVAAAAEPLVQKSKAEVARATSEIAFNKAVRELEIAKKNLASLWGQDGDGFILDASDFFTIQPPPALPDAAARLIATPDIARLEAELWRAKANLELERANAIPDPTLSLGMRDFRDSGDQAFVAGISIPIPVFNLNQGNISKAQHEVSKSESDKQVAALTLSNELTRAAQELQTAYDESNSLKATILPAADKAFSLARQGYQAGKFPYLEVLDAQRTLFEARSQYNTSLKNYHTHRAEVERLTAAHSDKIQPNEEHNE